MSVARDAEALLAAEQRIYAAARALGPALASVQPYVDPSLARAVQAQENLYDRIDDEFGLLSPAEAGRRLGSSSTAPRNYASSSHAAGRLLALVRNGRSLYPGFQFGDDGVPLPVVAALRVIGVECDQSETGIVQWLLAPTTYLGDGERPVDHLRPDPDAVLAAARAAWSVSW